MRAKREFQRRIIRKLPSARLQAQVIHVLLELVQQQRARQLAQTKAKRAVATHAPSSSCESCKGAPGLRGSARPWPPRRGYLSTPWLRSARS